MWTLFIGPRGARERNRGRRNNPAPCEAQVGRWCGLSPSPLSHPPACGGHPVVQATPPCPARALGARAKGRTPPPAGGLHLLPTLPRGQWDPQLASRSPSGPSRGREYLALESWFPAALSPSKSVPCPPHSVFRQNLFFFFFAESKLEDLRFSEPELHFGWCPRPREGGGPLGDVRRPAFQEWVEEEGKGGISNIYLLGRGL